MTAIHMTGTVNASTPDVRNHGMTDHLGDVAPAQVVATIPTSLPHGSGATNASRRVRRASRGAGGVSSALPGFGDSSPLVMTPAIETAHAVTRNRNGWVASARPARGVTVCGPDGASIGVLMEINRQGALVERPVRGAVYVPFAAIATVRDEQLVLTVAVDQVDRMPWRHPA